ncbi:MAG TPA: 50S ribosomal protein L6, partial [Methanoculleus sp.]|nr:50S ribosomal protein L6 [Methanoculleus sp.]
MGILRQIEIPPGVNARLEGSVLTVSGPKGTLVRDMRFPQIDVRIADGEVIVSTASDKRRFLAMSG